MNTRNLFALCGIFLLLGCKGTLKQKTTPFSEEYPFRGVWINDSPEEYLKLKIDLYSKSIQLSDDTELSYGFLNLANEYVEDYSIITDVLSVEGNNAEVMTYNLRYGEPDDKTKRTLTFDRIDGTIKLDILNVFPKDSACRYVEVLKPNVNVRTTPVNGTPMILAQRGQMMNLLDFDRGWYKVRLDNGEEGYISDDLSEAVRSNTIPQNVFEEIYNISENPTSFGYISFKVKGNKVLMNREYCSTPTEENNWNSVYQSSTVFYGTIDGNRLTFTRSLDTFLPNLDEIDPSDLEEIESYSVYYSPTEGRFIFEEETV